MTAQPKQGMAVYPVTVAVRSASRPGHVHMVHLPWCPCEDFQYRHARLLRGEIALAELFCKHLHQAMEQVGGLQAADDTPPVATKVYNDLTRGAAIDVIAAPGTGVSRDTALAGLLGMSTRNQFPRPGRPAIAVTVARNGRSRRYSVTVPA
jgi:hypothetical protein